MNGPYDDMIDEMVDENSSDGERLCRTLTDEMDRTERNSFDFLW